MSIDNRVNEDGFDFDQAYLDSMGLAKVFVGSIPTTNEQKAAWNLQRLNEAELQMDYEGQYSWDF